MAIILSGPDRLGLASKFFGGEVFEFRVADREDWPNKGAFLKCIVRNFDRNAEGVVTLTGDYVIPSSGAVADFQARYDPDIRKGSISFMRR